jgi:dienelactone hydrolase
MLSRCVAAAATMAALSLSSNVASAGAAPTVLNPTGQNGIACADKPDGTRFCEGSTRSSTPGGATSPVTTFDGTTLDVNVTLPPVSAAGADGRYPLIIIGHGWGGEKQGFDGHESFFSSPHELALRGYAVLNVTDRGWGGSCGDPQARLQNAQGCLKGWNHLLDARYEVHDVQFLAGELADEGFVAPQRIGAIGESYGGGLSLMLATLKDRVVNTDGTIAPWRSPNGLPMRIAAATPSIPWTDLIYSLLPNGRTLDNTITGATDDYTPAGVVKQSFVAGLFATGTAPPGTLGSGGYYAPPGADMTADLTQWFAFTNAGEPYESNPLFAGVIDQLKSFRSAYYVLQGSASPVAGLPGEAPAPLLLSNGFTDDLFPVDETVRYYNLERSLYPSDPIALTYMDYGHMRGQNKAADIKFLLDQVNAWIDHYVKGGAPDPGQPVTALTQTCPSTAASGGPFAADSWVHLHPGVLRYLSSASQTISSTGGDPSIARSFDPIAGDGACATASAANESGTANYALPKATGGGYTMLGAPEVIAQLSVTGQFPEIAERLLDVSPSGTETLVARGDYRPADTSKPVFFQLHPGAWHFAAGHYPKLELLGRDAPYLRASNGPFTIDVSQLALLLPTHETSGNGIVAANGAPIPPGATPAPGVTPRTLNSLGLGSLRNKRRASCSVAHRKAPKRRSARSRRASAGAARHATKRKRAARVCKRVAKHKAKRHSKK